MKKPLNIATLAKAIKRPRFHGLHVLEILKLQELGNSCKFRDRMMNQAVRTYLNNTCKEPSTYHKNAIEDAFRDIVPRTIGQPIARLFPSFVIEDQGIPVDVVI